MVNTIRIHLWFIFRLQAFLKFFNKLSSLSFHRFLGLQRLLMFFKNQFGTTTSLRIAPHCISRALFAVLLIGAFSSTSELIAHSQTTLTPAQNQQIQQSNPGRVNQVIEEEIKEKDDPIDKRQKIEEETEEETIEAPDTPEIKGATEGEASFVVNEINVEGNTLFPNSAFEPILNKYRGQSVTLSELSKVVEAINEIYRDQGYLTAQAFIPTQDIENGMMTIQIAEGIIGTVELSGNKYYRTNVLAKQLDMMSGDPLNIQSLEKTINRLNSQNNYRLKAVLRAGDNTGETDIRIDMLERQPWQITPSFDNQGRDFIGLNRWGVGLSNSNLLGMGDRLSTQWLAASGTQVAGGSYFIPLNKYGTEIGYSYTFSHVDVDLPGIPDSTSIEGTAQTHSAILSQPLDANRTFTADVAFNAKLINSQLNDVITSRVGISSISAGLTFNHPDRYGRSFARLQTDFAPKQWLGSTVSFWKASGTATRIHRLPKGMVLIVRGSAQFTPDALPAAEQYQVGGAFSVRGFSEGLLFGDRGYNVSTEIRWPIPFLDKVSPWLAQRVQGAVFTDLGQAWLDDSNPQLLKGISNQQNRTLIIGSGIGIRAQLTQYLTGFMDWGWGLTNQTGVEPQRQPNARLHFGISSNLLPTKMKKRTDKTVVISTPDNKQPRSPWFHPFKAQQPDLDVFEAPEALSALSIDEDIEIDDEGEVIHPELF